MWLSVLTVVLLITSGTGHHLSFRLKDLSNAAVQVDAITKIKCYVVKKL